MKRREFITNSGAAAAGTAVGAADVTESKGSLSSEGSGQANRFKKAVKYLMIDEDMSVFEKFQLLKDLGFDGVEIRSPNDLEEQEVESIKNCGASGRQSVLFGLLKTEVGVPVSES